MKPRSYPWKNHIAIDLMKPTADRLAVCVLIAAALLLGVGCASTPYTPGKASVGEVVTVPILQLHPTQSVVGEREVAEKESKIKGKDAAELREYIADHTVPVVIGPGNTLYMVDHHHTMLALLRSGRAQTCDARILANYSNLTMPEFWKQMEKKKWVYLKNGQGQPITPSQIPSTLTDMGNDPYRALAGQVRDEGGYRKTDIPFADFAWANYFRSQINMGPGQAGWDAAVKQAMAIAHSPVAQNLPGYINK